MHGMVWGATTKTMGRLLMISTFTGLTLSTTYGEAMVSLHYITNSWGRIIIIIIIVPISSSKNIALSLTIVTLYELMVVNNWFIIMVSWLWCHTELVNLNA